MSDLKKIERKQKKLQHIVSKETGVKCSPTPSKILAICNAGLVSGLTEETVVLHFSKFGTIQSINLLPGKSCCFLQYKELSSAVEALTTYNGKLNIAQDNKPIYLNYAESLPLIKTDKTWDKYPPGLIILKDFISEQEENSLVLICKFDNNKGDVMKHRQVKHFGYEFRYDNNNVDKDKPLDEAIPKECNFLWDKMKKTDCAFKDFYPDQLTVNHYSSGQGIPPHVDTHSAFEDPIMSLSLLSSVIMDFKNDVGDHFCVLLPRRSLAIMSGESRYNWTHGITPRKFDVINTTNGGFTTLERGTRISFTFRKVRRGICDCNYKQQCDSYQDSLKENVIEDNVALELEKKHVHDVYEKIANHFSDTRHKPWPNVLEFVQSLEMGDVLVDVGCGNGKYLGHNKNIFQIGCDRSFGLIDVCRDRGFESFTCNCLNLPLKDNIADAALSIAVIHHLANEERRLHAIKEIIRVLRPKGKALIYVWAKDQFKDKEKTSYIMQDRKHRKAKDVITSDLNEEMCVSENVTLPVHTNRTQFKHKDLLVPWKLKEEKNNEYFRFYHVFEENELETLCMKVKNVDIIKRYYDQGNWCVILQKNK